MKKDLCHVFFGRVDLETCTGWEVVVILLPGGKVGVGIDRLGYFTFSSKEALKYPHYVAEKLSMQEVDAVEMVKFFTNLFKGELNK